MKYCAAQTQSTLELAPGGDVEWAGQSMQSAAASKPGSSPNRPAGQSTHAVLSVVNCECVPLGQARHEELCQSQP